MFDPSKNFSLEMMLSLQNRGAWNKGRGGGGRRGALDLILLGTPRFGPQQPPENVAWL